MGIFESHAHYDDEAFDGDREELLKKLPESGIEYVVNVGASCASTKACIALAKEYDYIYAAVGVHPNETAELEEEFIAYMEAQAMTNSKVLAIGEIGLDYYWNEPEPAIQKKWFIRQLDLAIEVDKPVIIAAVFGTAPGPEPTPVDPSEDYIVSTSVVDDKKVIVSVISLDGGYLVAGTEVEVTFTTLVETVAFGQTVYKPTPVTETITIGDDKSTLENSTYELADILGDKYAVINVISKIGTAGFGNTSLNYKG